MFRWFYVTGEADGYSLILKGDDSEGDIDDQLTWSHGRSFGIFDNYQCTGGWWGCAYSRANLNGLYGENGLRAARWSSFDDYALKRMEMKFRKVRRD